MGATTLHYGTPIVQAVGGTGSFLNLMDALHTAFSACTKWAVNSTVGGAGAREVIELAPVGGTFPNQRVVLAGKSAGAPLMQSPDTFLASALLVGYGPDGGAFVGATWATATPNLYGAARQIPFSRASAAATNFAEVVIFESADDFLLQVRASTNYYAVIAGAWLRTPIQAESESNSYCLQGYVSSGSTAISTTWAQSNNLWLSNFSTSANPHAYVMDPGLATVLPLTRCLTFDGATKDTTGAGNRIYAPIGTYRNSSRVMGEAREKYFASGQFRTVAQDGSGNQYLLFGPSTSSNVDALALKV